MARILLVEPDRKLANTYVRAFEMSGHNVVVSMGAQKGILAADITTPDIVVLELQLVAHSGIEFLYEFRSYVDWQHIPVVICSNVPPREFAASEKLLQRLSVQSYCYKPRTSLAALLEAVEDALQSVASVEKMDNEPA